MANRAQHKKQLVIVGGGFTGTLTAAHLTLGAGFVAGKYSVTLVERVLPTSRGIAYSTPYLSHVLNVPAQGMSPWLEPEDALVQWLRAQDPELAPSGDLEADFTLRHSFVPRSTYGTYLESIVQKACSRGLEIVQGDVQGLTVDKSHVSLRLAQKSTLLLADRVALCLGHFPPVLPLMQAPVDLQYPQYIANPWQWRAIEAIDAQADVLILGTGLTMVDTVLSLLERKFTGRITAISRHGLAPQPHLLGLARLPIGLPSTQSAARLLRDVRRAARPGSHEGGDWRQSVDGLRHATAKLWQALSVRHQKQILRHAKSYWDVHRHRIAPHVADILRREQNAGRLRLLAGRLQHVAVHGQQLHVSVRRRHDGQTAPLQADHLINCTGGHNNWLRSTDPLVCDLLAQKRVLPDVHGLGVQANFEGQLLDAAGRPSRVLFTAGPSLVGRDFESVAVPELKQQAAQLALRLAR